MTKNILIFILDHLTQRALSCYDKPGEYRIAHTPTMDAITSKGQVFENIYCTFPLCMPSRASFWMGQYPHTTKVISNGDQVENGPLPDLPTMGESFSAAGYNAIHFGKGHDHGTLRGFDIRPQGRTQSPDPVPEGYPEHYDSENDYVTVNQMEEWFASDAPQEKPFIAVADIQNPHDICSWIGYHNSMEGTVNPLPTDRELPPLPDNFEIDDMETRPKPVQYICCSHNRLCQASHWEDDIYRRYIAAFGHYTEKADQSVGRILKALEASGKMDDTLIVLMGDHGDGMASHRMVTKQVSFYEEITKVPFVLSGPGIEKEDNDTRIGNLNDLFPTLLSYAGIEVPSVLPGKNLLANESLDREYTACEWYSEWGYTISPGRMIRTKKFKYTHYLEENGEELYDLENDPGETKNLALDPTYADELERHRERLKRHVEESNDDYYSLQVKVDPRYRAHKPGYQHHVGKSAPMIGRGQ